MNKIFFLFLILSALLTVSCGSNKKLAVKASSTTQLSDQLGFPVRKKDNLKLYTEAAQWLGTPYKYGGNTRTGVDCSGLVCQIYRVVYDQNLERTVAGMYKKNCRKSSRSSLKPGDLVFFNTAKGKKSISHVGIFLKEDFFIHSTTSSGVKISGLSEVYYKKRWINGGKVKKQADYK